MHRTQYDTHQILLFKLGTTTTSKKASVVSYREFNTMQNCCLYLTLQDMDVYAILVAFCLIQLITRLSKLLNLLVANILPTMCAQSVLCPVAAAYQCGHQISSDLATGYPANSLVFFAHGKT